MRSKRTAASGPTGVTAREYGKKENLPVLMLLQDQGAVQHTSERHLKRQPLLFTEA